MNRLLLMACALLAGSAVWAAPGDLQDSVRARVAQGAQNCGLQIWSGRDARLPWAIRNRMVDDVIVRVFADGRFIPGILVDRKIRDSNDEEMALVYMNANGGHLLNLTRDYRWDDLSVWTREQGITAYSQTALSGNGPVTRFYIRPAGRGMLLVNERSFTEFVNVELADGFVDWFCRFN
jgi:hypothetical protein